MPAYRPIEERFWEKVDRNGPWPKNRRLGRCWVWIAGKHKRGGYGQLRGPKKTTLKAHRVAWELANRKSAGSLHILHKCDNPVCCRPTHLWAGTNNDNIIDRIVKGRFVSANPLQHQKRLLRREIESRSRSNGS